MAGKIATLPLPKCYERKKLYRMKAIIKIQLLREKKSRKKVYIPKWVESSCLGGAVPSALWLASLPLSPRRRENVSQQGHNKAKQRREHNRVAWCLVCHGWQDCHTPPIWMLWKKETLPYESNYKDTTVKKRKKSFYSNHDCVFLTINLNVQTMKNRKRKTLPDKNTIVKKRKKGKNNLNSLVNHVCYFKCS